MDEMELRLEAARRQRSAGDHVAALAAFEAAAALNSDHRGIRVELAHELRMLGRLDDAERLLVAVLAEDSGDAGALIERGHLFRRLRDHAQAAASFAAAVSIDPSHIPLRLELARERRALGQLDAAEEALDELIGRDPGNAAAAIERGLVRRQRNNRVGAGMAFAAAAAAVPQDVDIRLELGRELRAAEFLEEAEMVLRAALAINPRHVEALVERALLSRRRGDRANALEGFRSAVDQDPGHVGALVELAHEYAFASLPGDAAATLDRALARSPNDYFALMASAELALASGDDERALRVARKARTLHPGRLAAFLLGARAEAPFGLAAAEAVLDEAVALFGASAALTAARVHVLRVHGENRTARRLVAEHAGQVGSDTALWGEAVALAIADGEFGAAERALASPPHEAGRSVEIVFGLRGQLAQARRDYAAAMRHYLDAVHHGGLRPEWRADLAQCFLLLGDVENASAHLRASLERREAGRLSGRPAVNVSQHHLGQLIDELRLDRDLLRRLQGLGDLAAGDRIDALADLVRHNPDHTGPALLLLVAMRQAGRFDVAPAHSGSPPARSIPRRIAQYWHASLPPPDVAALMATWRDANPNYECLLFDDRTAWAFLVANAPAEAARAFRQAADAPQRADIFRLAYLATAGGVVVDADDRCAAPLGAAIESAALVAYQETLGSVGTNFLAAAPGHAVVVNALALAVEAVNRGDRDTVWLATGPGLLTRAFAQEMARASLDASEEVLLLETFALRRFVDVHCPAAYKRRHRSGLPAAA